MSNEQWLEDGICAKCRRADYCGKDCTAFKKRKAELMKKAMNDVLGSKYPEVRKILGLEEE